MAVYVRIGPDRKPRELTKADAQAVYQAMFERDPLHTLLAKFDPKNPTEISVSAPEDLMRKLDYIPKEEFLASHND